MKCRLGLLALAWQTAAQRCIRTTLTDPAGLPCLLQLKGRDAEGTRPLSGRDAAAAGAGAGAVETELELELELGAERSGRDAAAAGAGETHPEHPAEPDWIEYPSDLSRILGTMVVTRYWGDAKHQLLRSAIPVPALYERFDCVRHVAFDKTTLPCKTLLCQADKTQIARCASAIEDGTLDVASGEFVAFFGEDLHLSEVLSGVKAIGSHFEKAYFEGYDVLEEDIDVLPIGLQEYYLRFQDFKRMSELVKGGYISPKEAKVLGAHGKFFTIENPSRRSAAALCASHGQEPWLSCDAVRPQDWWATLSTYSFLLNPAGNGVQSPKFHEALLMGAVPICTKEAAFVKLEQSGWPLLLVDSFDEVASMNLTQKYETYRPRLASIHKYLFLDGYWKYLETGHFF